VTRIARCRYVIELVRWVLAAATVGCGGAGEYVWYTQLSSEAVTAGNEYIINVGDVVNVRVLGHDEMSTRVRARPDGRIALPIIGDVEVGGKRPSAVRSEIESRLKAYLVMPSVTVNIDETQPIRIAVLGEVAHPGVFPAENTMRLADALALGGGLTDYASRDRIFVVRTLPQPARVRFTLRSVLRDEGHAAEFPLHGGDVVVVE
jgi:polysaccharide export outer membrane protein